MDHRSALGKSATAADEPVVGDQAIFTSIRSTTGSGYRIVASSPGLRAEEKVDITRRSPSHGSLCDDDPGAVALSAYSLPSGRFCVADSRYDGAEPSARGGLRIRTQAIVLDACGYRRFGCNPVAVHAALLDANAGAPRPGPSGVLEPLSLTARCHGNISPTMHWQAKEIDWTLFFVAEVLAGRSMILAGTKSPVSFLDRLFSALPLFVREKQAITLGVKFSPTRRTQVALVGRDTGASRRLIRGLDVRWFDADSVPPVQEEFQPRWMSLVRHCWTEGRSTDLNELNIELGVEHSTEDLERIASICDDLYRVERASPNELLAMLGRHGSDRRSRDVERRLLRHLIETANSRMAVLTESLPSD